MVIPAALAGLGAGLALMTGLMLLLDDTTERIKTVQEHSAQLSDQLEHDFPGMGRLLLNDETNTYEFRVAPEGEQPQTCEGTYEVADGNAQAVGTIACTTTTKLGG